MRMILFLILFSCALGVTAQPVTVYCLPGQGADRHLFDSLQLGPGYRLQFIEYGTPQRGMDMAAFAQSLLVHLDTTAPFVLLGTSLGGMLSCELAEVTHPQKTIIISSAKNRRELPFRYRFQKKVPLYKIVPGRVMHFGAKMLQPLVEPDRNRNKSTFKQMLGAKQPRYMKRSVGLIIGWERAYNTARVYHIHGAKDHTIPIRNVRVPDRVVADGSHMMTLTRGTTISALVLGILRE